MQVSKWLGHSTFTLTLDTYGDYIPEQDGGALNTLPEPPAPTRQAAANVVELFGRRATLRGTRLVVQSLCDLGLVGRGPL